MGNASCLPEAGPQLLYLFLLINLRSVALFSFVRGWGSAHFIPWGVESKQQDYQPLPLLALENDVAEWEIQAWLLTLYPGNQSPPSETQTWGSWERG